jgi:hypothetical protein
MLALLAAVMSFVTPGWDVVFCIVFFGFMISAQARNVYFNRAAEKFREQNRGPDLNT